VFGQDGRRSAATQIGLVGVRATLATLIKRPNERKVKDQFGHQRGAS
jgi:hypothetical protein